MDVFAWLWPISVGIFSRRGCYLHMGKGGVIPLKFQVKNSKSLSNFLGRLRPAGGQRFVCELGEAKLHYKPHPIKPVCPKSDILVLNWICDVLSLPISNI